MHLELVDLLRCLQPHEPTPLVLASDRGRDRAVLDGVLGCPLCGAEYPVVDGVARYARAQVPQEETDAGDPLRGAALLDLTDARRRVATVGASVAFARAMQTLVGAGCVVIDPPDEHRAAMVDGHAEEPLAVLRTAGAIPVAPGSLHGVMLHEHAFRRGGGDTLLTAALQALRPKGRLVAPIAMPLPAGATELARDGRQWVAQAADRDEGGSGLVALRRRR